MDQDAAREAGLHTRTWRNWARDWVPAVAALLLALAIVQLAMFAGLNAAALFDASSDYGAPGAHPPGHFETLAAERLTAYFFAFQASIVALTLVAARLVPVLRLRALALAYPRGGLAAIALAVVGLLVGSAAIGSLIYHWDRASFMHDLRPFAQMARSDNWWMLLAAAGAGAPLAEEMLFRGLLFGGLRASPLGFFGAAGISAGFWTALHASYSIYALGLLFLIGVYFAWLRERTQSLWPSIVAHAVYNSTIVVALALTPETALQ